MADQRTISAPTTTVAARTEQFALRLWSIFAVTLFVFACHAGSAYAGPYLLGPEDKLKIKVYEWRSATAEAHEWTALTGEFSVSASGNVSLPLIGEIPASGQTTADLAATIAQKLQATVDLANRPDASVEVVTYRPFYILGMVTTPGQYAYKPDLTVLKAISIAGGIRRMLDSELLALERDSVASRGDINTLAVERISLRAREARLNAELLMAGTITFPTELSAPENWQLSSNIMREEQLLFESRRTALSSQEDSFNQTKSLLAAQIRSLKEKSVAIQRQVDLAKQELENVNSLAAKGLTVSSRQLQLEQTVSQFETTRIDLDLTVLRAEQDLEKAQRDILALRNKHRDTVLNELSDVRARLAVNLKKNDTAQKLLETSTAEVTGTALSQPFASRKLTFMIIRTVNGGTSQKIANGNDEVLPGDTIDVRLDGNITSTVTR